VQQSQPGTSAVTHFVRRQQQQEQEQGPCSKANLAPAQRLLSAQHEGAICPEPAVSAGTGRAVIGANSTN
jgi:hypothetical protein